jgi:uncharacterized protein (DUF1778 family)
MAARKTTTLNLRIDASIKEAIKLAADKDHRSITNFLELLVRKHCADAGITIPEQHTLFEEPRNGR